MAKSLIFEFSIASSTCSNTLGAGGSYVAKDRSVEIAKTRIEIARMAVMSLQNVFVMAAAWLG
jgi:hypothetical protein